MTDPDPAGALVSSQLQQEKEVMESRVEPLTAGDDGQDLPQRSQTGEVSDAERTEPRFFKGWLFELYDALGVRTQGDALNRVRELQEQKE